LELRCEAKGLSQNPALWWQTAITLEWCRKQENNYARSATAVGFSGSSSRLLPLIWFRPLCSQKISERLNVAEGFGQQIPAAPPLAICMEWSLGLELRSRRGGNTNLRRIRRIIGRGNIFRLSDQERNDESKRSYFLAQADKLGLLLSQYFVWIVHS
jgi:hypothetical protein